MNIKFNSVTYNILKAYSFLETVTPLKSDCGKLCGSKCCDGSENDGMWLFPHEAELFKDKNEFKLIDCPENFGYPKLICNGTCERNQRPLACRMFPLFPYVFKNGENEYIVRVMNDVRSQGYCPLTDSDFLDRSFERAVRLAANSVLRVNDIKDYLINLTELLTSNPF